MFFSELTPSKMYAKMQIYSGIFVMLLYSAHKKYLGRHWVTEVREKWPLPLPECRHWYTYEILDEISDLRMGSGQ